MKIKIIRSRPVTKPPNGRALYQYQHSINDNRILRLEQELRFLERQMSQQKLSGMAAFAAGARTAEIMKELQSKHG